MPNACSNKCPDCCCCSWSPRPEQGAWRGAPFPNFSTDDRFLLFALPRLSHFVQAVVLAVMKVLRECFIVAPHHSLGTAGRSSAGMQRVLEGELRPTKTLILKHLLWPLLVSWLHWWPPTPPGSALPAPGFLQPCGGEGGQVTVLQRCQQQWSAWLGLQATRWSQWAF